MRERIAAIATPPGQGGVGVIRLSGPSVLEVAPALLGRSHLAPRHAQLCRFLAANGATIDQGLALFFPAPNSFTGEDVLEIHAHGSPVVLDLLLQRLLALGVRLARPGEFSERAFLNGKLDLAQAEAVADLIASGTAAAARAAMSSLQGVFSKRVGALREGLIRLRVHVEAAIDFPEEDIDFLADGQIRQQLDTLCAQLDTLLSEATQGQLLRDGMQVVLAGRPNAGKSSLLNMLVQRDAAIVTDIPGTTRDLLRESLSIDGLPLHITDTAGLRDASDAVEREGIRRAHHAMQQADRILVVVDDCAGPSEAEAELHREFSGRCTLLRNKIDLSGRSAGCHHGAWGEEIALSALDGRGLDALHAHLKHCMGFNVPQEGTFTARRRHLDALQRCQSSLQLASEQLDVGAGELMAEELLQAQNHLGEITGEFSADDLLGEIFSSFCIGK